MTEQTIQVLFAVALPLVLTVAFVLAIALIGRRRGGALLATWAVPAVASGCVLASYLAQMRDRSGRWQWLVAALAAVPLVWAALLAVRRRRLVMTLIAAPVLAAVAGGLAATAVYPSQPAAYRLVVPAAVLALTLALYPLASRATAADALAVGLAGFATAAVVVLGQFLGAAELLTPSCVAAGVAGLSSLVVRKPAVRRRLLAGALGLGLLPPAAALVGWVNSYDLRTPLAWAFILPAAGLPLLWLSRLPVARRHPKTAAAVAFVLAVTPAAVGLSLAVLHTDLRPFGINVNNAAGAGDGSSADDYSAYY